MKRIYKPIKNEIYPYIIGLIIIFLLMVWFFTMINHSILYTIPAIIFLIISIIIALIVYNESFAYIKIDNNNFEYFYKGFKDVIRIQDIVDVRYAYPDKTIFADRTDLYEIKIICISSINNKDFIFHYMSGNKYHYKDNIRRPYIKDPSLEKGMWLSTSDSSKIIAFLKTKLGMRIVSI